MRAPLALRIRRRLQRATSRRLARLQAQLLGRSPHSYEEQLYAALVRVGDTCLDVGANTGSVSAYLSQLTGRSGLVVAFEPVWATYRELLNHLRAEAYEAPVIPVPLGLSDTERRAEINIPDGNYGMSSLASPDAWRGAQRQVTFMETQSVQLTTLDAFVEMTRLPVPQFVKIDVEGAEMFVLRGASKQFRDGWRPLMLIEVFAPWEKACGYQPWEPLSLLSKHGYAFLFACPEGLVAHVPTADAPFPEEYERGYNLIAYCPAVHAERIKSLRPFLSPAAVGLLPMAPAPLPNRIL